MIPKNPNSHHATVGPTCHGHEMRIYFEGPFGGDSADYSSSILMSQ